MVGSLELVLFLDWLEQAVLLVTGSAVITHANRAAVRLLSGGGLTRDAGGAIACHLPGETCRLRRLIRQAATAAHQRLGVLFVVHRRCPERPLSVLVAPLAGDRPREPGAPAAALLVGDPERPAAPPEAHLRELYSLTAAEARVAVAVLDAGSLQEIAGRLGVSANCIRIHLQHVFDKTGTHRQAELVRLLLAHRLPAAGPSAPERLRSGDQRLPAPHRAWGATLLAFSSLATSCV